MPAFTSPAILRTQSPASATKRKHASAFSCKLKTLKDTLISWNVNSLRALQRKHPHIIKHLVRSNNASVLCLQETKLREELEDEVGNVVDPHWFCVYNSSKARLGYSGTAIFSRRYFPTCNRQIGHYLGDTEGRSTTIELENCFVVSAYAMSCGVDMKRLPQRMEWDSNFRRHVRRLRNLGKGVIVLGDMNVARTDLDVWDVNYYKEKPCFSNAERQSFEDTLETCGLVDVFRDKNPSLANQFTAFGYSTRARGHNCGVRIDYALVSEDLLDAVRDVRVLDDVIGSDHCPIALDLKVGIL